MDTLLDILSTSWRVTTEMAPWLLFGFAMAGVLHVLISPAWVQRHLSGRGLLPIVKSAVLGVPLPLCSCGVIPVTAGMLRQGASRGAAASFLLATPETGVDSIFATYALLGPVFAVVRPLVALLNGIIGGTAIDIFAGTPPHQTPVTADACHADGNNAQRSPWWRRMTRYALVTLPGDIAWPLVIGIGVTGLITALIGPGALEPYLGGGPLAMLIMIAIGTPIYVCSTGSIPLALSFMHLGASPGAALAFLISGPATNSATIAVTWKLMGKRAAIIYVLTVIGSSLAAGLLLDAMNISVPSDLLHHGAHDHVMPLTWTSHLFGAILVAVIVAGIVSRRFTKAGPTMSDDTSGQTLELSVKGMTCSHCVDTVARTIRSLPGVKAASVELASGRATVRGEALSKGAIVAAIQAVGYEATLQ